MYILFCTLFHCGLSQNIEHSSLCYAVGPVVDQSVKSMHLIRSRKCSQMEWAVLPKPRLLIAIVS